MQYLLTAKQQEMLLQSQGAQVQSSKATVLQLLDAFLIQHTWIIWMFRYQDSAELNDSWWGKSGVLCTMVE